jgi:bacillithiol system protein YtxJ
LALKDRIQFLTSPPEVDGFLRANKNAALFKAGTCHKTNETFQQVESVLGPREDLPLGVVRVVESRAASNHIAELTGITHESPQLILFKDGTPVFDRDNWDITGEDIEEALRAHFAPVAR